MKQCVHFWNPVTKVCFKCGVSMMDAAGQPQVRPLPVAKKQDTDPSPAVLRIDGKTGYKSFTS